MIASFRHKGLKKLYEKGDGSGVNQNHRRKIENILSMLDAATRPDDLDLPGFAFHPLKGDLKGHYAVKVSGNWRITFRFVKEPEDVDLMDYH